MTTRAGARQELSLAAASAHDVLTYDDSVEGVLDPIRRGGDLLGVFRTG